MAISMATRHLAMVKNCILHTSYVWWSRMAIWHIYWHLVVKPCQFHIATDHLACQYQWQFDISLPLTSPSRMAIWHCYWHLLFKNGHCCWHLVKNGNFTLLLTSSVKMAIWLLLQTSSSQTAILHHCILVAMWNCHSWCLDFEIAILHQ